MNRVYVKIMVSESGIPDTHFVGYNTDKGLVFEHEFEDNDVTYYWKEIELPNEEYARQIAGELAQDGVYQSTSEMEAYVDGFNLLMEHLKEESKCH